MRTEENSTLYKIHKPNNPLQFFATGGNTAIEDLSCFILLD